MKLKTLIKLLMKGFLPLSLLVAIGCGNTVATVSGKITLDGIPLEKGDIGFHQAEGLNVSTVRVNPDGSYSIGSASSTTPGNYKVVVIANDVIIGKGPGSVPMPKLITPKIYSNKETTPLKAELKAGSNVSNFDLISKSP